MTVSEIGTPALKPAFFVKAGAYFAVLTFLYEQSGAEHVIQSNKNEKT